MLSPKPIGQDRVSYKLSQALVCIEKLKELSQKTQSSKNQNRISSSKNKLKRIKTSLVFLSTKARDKVTRFYASNALKEIAQKMN